MFDITIWNSSRYLIFELIANGKGKEMTCAPVIEIIDEVLANHIWLIYTPQFYNEKSNALLWEGDANGFSKIGIKIGTGDSGMEVKKCGFHMAYKKDRRSRPNSGPV